MAAVVALAVAGCGGSAAPTRATYSKEIDKVCLDTQDRVKALQGFRRGSNDDVARIVRDLSRTLDEGVAKLRAVQRPDGNDGAKAVRWLDALERQNDEVVEPALAELAAAAQRGDLAAQRRAAAKVEASNSARVDALSRAAGARECD